MPKVKRTNIESDPFSCCKAKCPKIGLRFNPESNKQNYSRQHSNFFYYFIFQGKQDLAFNVNCLYNSYKMSSLFFLKNTKTNDIKMLPATIVINTVLTLKVPITTAVDDIFFLFSEETSLDSSCELSA